MDVFHSKLSESNDKADSEERPGVELSRSGYPLRSSDKGSELELPQVV